MRYFKIADSFMFATEEMGRKELKRPKNLSITIKPWSYCFRKRNTAYILALFYLLLNIIGFDYSSNHCHQSNNFLDKRKKTLVYRIWIGIDNYYTSNSGKVFLWDNLCVKQHSTKLWWRSRLSWTFNNLLLWEVNIDILRWRCRELSITLLQETNIYWQFAVTFSRTFLK